jgi:hypothetical protein
MITAKANTRLAMAIALALGSAAAVPVAGAAEPTVGALEEIVVTARKRVENLQDVGTSLSALSAEDLRIRFDATCSPCERRAEPDHRRPSAGPGQSGRHFHPRRRHHRRREELRPDGRRRGRRRVHRRQLRRHDQGHRPGAHRGAARPPGHAVRSQLDRRRHQRHCGPSPRPTASRRGARGRGQPRRPAAGWLRQRDRVETFAFRLGGAKRENDGWFYNAPDRDVGESSTTADQPVVLLAAHRQPRDLLPVRQDRAGPGRQHRAQHGAAGSGLVLLLRPVRAGAADAAVRRPLPCCRTTGRPTPYQTYFDTRPAHPQRHWDINDRYGRVRLRATSRPTKRCTRTGTARR